jgi:hypothetical protein
MTLGSMTVVDILYSTDAAGRTLSVGNMTVVNIFLLECRGYLHQGVLCRRQQDASCSFSRDPDSSKPLGGPSRLPCATLRDWKIIFLIEQ